MSTPFFTIITATFNAGATLPRLLDSLAAQTCRDFELVIQDGASSDNTLEIVEAYKERLPAVSIGSESDAGIYDAWNKALPRIRGQWVIFLGADDALLNAETLANVYKKAVELPDSVTFAAGDVVIFDDATDISLQYGLDENALARLRAGESAVHSGLFQRSSVFRQGGFDARYAVSGDHDFVLSHWQKPSDGIRLGIPVTRMAIGGTTSSLHNVFRFRCEFARVMKKHFGFKVALACLPGIIKGVVPYILSRVLAPERALAVYNTLRNVRKLPSAHIK